MRLRQLIILAAAAVSAPCAASACTILVEQTGDLGVSVDGLTIGSEEEGGREAQIRVQSDLLGNTVSVTALQIIAAPAAFDETGIALEVAYKGSGLLDFVDQAYTEQDSNFVVGGLINDTFNLNARAVTVAGVVEGIYRLRTVVTCS